MFTFRKRRHSSPHPQSLRTSNSVESNLTAAPKRMTSSLKRKTLSSAKITSARAVFGVFSTPQRAQASTGAHTHDTLDAAKSYSSGELKHSKRKSIWNIFSNVPTFSRSKTKTKTDAEMFEERENPNKNLFSGLFSSAHSGNESRSVVKNMHSRMSFNSHRPASPVLTRKVFRPVTFHYSGTLRRQRGPLASLYSSEPASSSSDNTLRPDLTDVISNKESNLSTHELPELRLPHATFFEHASPPIDVPSAATSSVKESSMMHSAESVGRLTNDEFGYPEADDSLLSASPPEDVPARPALPCERYPRALNDKTDDCVACDVAAGVSNGQRESHLDNCIGQQPAQDEMARNLIPTECRVVNTVQVVSPQSNTSLKNPRSAISTSNRLQVPYNGTVRSLAQLRFQQRTNMLRQRDFARDQENKHPQSSTTPSTIQPSNDAKEP